MIICKTIISLKRQLSLVKEKHYSIGFIPTMGALHDGHLSLIRASISQNHCTVCSIFVNPTQFNNQVDYDKYPKTIKEDILQLEITGCNILFLPSIEEIYPEGLTSSKHYDLGDLETMLEGKYRPNHFQGVCQIVEKLLNIVEPNQLFLGQKDYQQCMVIEKLISIMGISNKTKLIMMPTTRERNGLAMSSRNARLNEIEKEKATTLYKAMLHIKNQIHDKSFDKIEREAELLIQKNGFEKVDYIKICHASDLQQAHDINSNEKLIILIAAFINGVRLIDNMELNY